MGNVAIITNDKFPKQGELLGKPVSVFFHHSTTCFNGICVRDDMEKPYVCIFKLDDGRHVLATECQYTY